MTALATILEVLESGEATTADIANVTGIPIHSCRAHLSELRRMGLVVEAGRVPLEIIVTRRVPLFARSEAA